MVAVVVGGHVQVEKPYLVGHQEFAALYGVKAQMVSQWLSRGVLDGGAAAVISGVRYWPLGFAVRFGESTPRPKYVDQNVLAELIGAQAPARIVERREQLPPIVGQHEIMSLFRLPAQGNLASTIATGRFAAPDWQLSGSGLWLLDTVLDDVPRLRASARSLLWQPDPDVLSALRDGRYDGPGSAVLSRGPWART